MYKRKHLLLPLLFLFLFAIGLQSLFAQAWRDALCTRSVLAEGHWVKVRVGASGVYKITDAELRRMGFDTPQKVHAYGYGGYLLSQDFSLHPAADLPLAPSLRLDDALLFYARGTVSWQLGGDGQFSHEQNFYTRSAYYFLSDRELDTTDELPLEASVTTNASPLTTFDEHILHEEDAYSWANTGRKLYEAYDYQQGATKEYALTLPGIVPESDAHISVAFAARSVGQESSFSVAVEGVELASQSLPAITADNQYYVKATEATLNTSFQTSASERLRVAVTHHRPSSVSGRLDYIVVTYPRALMLEGGMLAFRSRASVGKESVFMLQGATADTQVWDVTSPWQACRMDGTVTGDTFTFAISAGGLREFVAINPAATSFPTVEVVGVIPNQDLHASEIVDMVIVAPDKSDLLQQAERLAEVHRERDGLTVSVIPVPLIYNEFSSGTPDATAYRRLMKMYYDRAGEAGVTPPRYLLLFGDCSFDNRMLTTSWQSASPDNYLLSYQSENSLVETSSYVTDDYFGFLDDTEGTDLPNAGLDVGIGRFPVRTLAEAKAVVEKTLAYMENKNAGAWKQNVCYVADDGDENLHVSQAEILATYTETHYPALRVERLFADAYRRESSASGYTYPDAAKRLLQLFERGMLVVNYTGHGSSSAWAAENLLTQKEIRSLTSPRLPLWITATCDFTRFDDVQTSAGEEAFLNASGGAIALLTTTRAVYASQNSLLNQVFLRHIFSRPDGHRLRLGDVMRLSKCDASLAGDRNKLNFTLIGDPALTLAYPEYQVTVDEFDGLSAEELQATGTYPQIKAGEKVTVRGRVMTEAGTTAEDFNGTLHPTVYDSQQEVQTLDNLSEGAFHYTERNKVLFAGSDSVRNGYFEFSFRVPLDINYSDETGLLNLYALDAAQGNEAGGAFQQFLVGGTDENITQTDSLGPAMKLYLNVPEFRSGEATNETPLFVAELEDAEGINTVGSGVGHDLTLCIDDSPVLTYNLNDYYQPVAGDYTRGTVRFSIPELMPGSHTLSFRAWNLLNHSTLQTLDFEVVRGLQPDLLSVKCTNSPARHATTFVLSHNRPGSTLSVCLTVYDFAGRTVWTHTEQGVSANQNYYVEWDLCSNSGQRLLPGVYLYRISLASGGRKASSRAQKLLILAQ